MSENHKLEKLKLSSDIDDIIDSNEITTNRTKYNLKVCKIENLSCQLDMNSINYIHTDALSDQTLSIFYPIIIKDRCRDFLVYVDNISCKIDFISEYGSTILKDIDTHKEDLTYMNKTKALYSFTEIKTKTFVMSKKELNNVK